MRRCRHPAAYDTVVVDNPTSGSYTVALPAGSWTKVLDATGGVSVTGTTSCGPMSVTVFRKS